MSNDRYVVLIKGYCGVVLPMGSSEYIYLYDISEDLDGDNTNKIHINGKYNKPPATVGEVVVVKPFRGSRKSNRWVVVRDG